MRPTFELVPRTGPTVQGAAQVTKALPSTSNPAMLGAAKGACFCGPGRSPTSRFTCITCAGFARIDRRIEARAPYLYAEVRRV